MHDFKPIRLRIIRSLRERDVEEFRVEGNNRFLVVRSNRPFLRWKGLKSKTIQWRLVAGEIYNRSFYDALINALDAQVLAFEKGDPSF